jgi:hypothetical protein
MTQPCHICGTALSALYPLTTHIADVHSDDAKHVTVIADELGLPVVECDIDAIHSSAIVAEKARAVHGQE